VSAVVLTHMIRVKDNKIVSGFSQTQQYILFYFYLDDMFRSIGQHQAIFSNTRFRI